MPDLTLIGLIGLSIAILFFIYIQNRKGASQRLIQAVTTLIDGVYRDLYVRAAKTADPYRASLLAGSATNEVFGFEAPNEEAAEFLKANKGEVQSLAAQMAREAEVRPLIAAALKYMTAPNWKGPMRPKGGLARAVNMGLIDPSEKPMPNHAFLAKTAKYHRRMVQESDKIDRG